MEVKLERAKDRVGRNDRLSPGSGRSMQRKGGGKAVKGLWMDGQRGKVEERCRCRNQWSEIELDERMSKSSYFESPLAGPLPPSKMGPAYSPCCPFWPLLPLGFLPF